MAPRSCLGLKSASCIGLVTTIIYTIVIDKVGRRPIVLIFFGFQCAALWLIGGLYYVHTKGSQLALVSVQRCLTCQSSHR